MKLMLRYALGIILLGLLLVGSWSYFSYQQFIAEPVAIQHPMTFKLAKGDSGYRVINNLVKQNIISQPRWAKLYLQISKKNGLKAGTYQLQSGMTFPQLIELFIDGKEIQHQLTFIEGWNIHQLRQFVSQQPTLTKVTTDWTDEQLLEAIGATESHLEGLFFPDTYHFPEGYRDIDLYQRAYQRLTQTLAEEWQQREAELPYENAYEALIMASIVEKETGRAEERATIAGVFVRRMQKRMRLQTDPTVIYGIGADFDGDIKRVHLRTDTPYNTYTRHGLPPTPIAIVGRESIHAALHPAPGKVLYFVSRGDGSHHFSETLQEHNAAVRKYQLKQK
ncbi:endolytic transglycosylase MltG [Pleionea sp. CnH1-48]|uniref:endolytic transglycosylase MltG n=1 Tax=Pleionea sp. CnH1-48 TaxID=2954494 RepID=UPI002097C931|nr:endolytic transglycosylase MltG [Pleionea sp. CnH1-48]MCO7225871.1 endolytic transglycosylase MltG [Pleionea sp. CnH1-48]